MIEKILVPVDGSNHSNKAAEFALNLAKKLGTKKVTFLNVIAGERPTVALLRGEVEFSSVREELKKESKEILENYKKMADDYEVKIETKTRIGGTPGKEIIKEVKENGYDQVIMGSAGLSKETGMILGSVASHVVKNCSCPVNIIR